MSELNDKLLEIKRQKDTYILPENIKKDVTVFGVTGTYKSNLHKYNTIADMQNDEIDKDLNEYGIVYGDEPQSISSISNLNMGGIVFPEELVLDQAYEGSFNANFVFEDTGYYMSKGISYANYEDDMMMTRNCYIRFTLTKEDWGSMMTTTYFSVEYKSDDGITFTRSSVAGDYVKDNVGTFPAIVTAIEITQDNNNIAESILLQIVKYTTNEFNGIYKIGDTVDYSSLALYNFTDGFTYNNGTYEWSGDLTDQSVVRTINFYKVISIINKLIADGKTSIRYYARFALGIDNNIPYLYLHKDSDGKYDFVSDFYIYQNCINTDNDNKIYLMCWFQTTNVYRVKLNLDTLTYEEESIALTPLTNVADANQNKDAYAVQFFNRIYLRKNNNYDAFTEIDLDNDDLDIQLGSYRDYQTLLSFTRIDGNGYISPAGVNFSTKHKYFAVPNQFTLDNANQVLPNYSAFGKDGTIIEGDGSVYDNLDYDIIANKFFGISDRHNFTRDMDITTDLDAIGSSWYQSSNLKYHYFNLDENGDSGFAKLEDLKKVNTGTYANRTIYYTEDKSRYAAIYTGDSNGQGVVDIFDSSTETLIKNFTLTPNSNFFHMCIPSNKRYLNGIYYTYSYLYGTASNPTLHYIDFLTGTDTVIYTCPTNYSHSYSSLAVNDDYVVASFGCDNYQSGKQQTFYTILVKRSDNTITVIDNRTLNAKDNYNHNCFTGVALFPDKIMYAYEYYNSSGNNRYVNGQYIISTKTNSAATEQTSSNIYSRGTTINADSNPLLPEGYAISNTMVYRISDGKSLGNISNPQLVFSDTYLTRSYENNTYYICINKTTSITIENEKPIENKEILYKAKLSTIFRKYDNENQQYIYLNFVEGIRSTDVEIISQEKHIFRVKIVNNNGMESTIYLYGYFTKGDPQRDSISVLPLYVYIDSSSSFEYPYIIGTGILDYLLESTQSASQQAEIEEAQAQVNDLFGEETEASEDGENQDQIDNKIDGFSIFT